MMDDTISKRRGRNEAALGFSDFKKVVARRLVLPGYQSLVQRSDLRFPPHPPFFDIGPVRFSAPRLPRGKKKILKTGDFRHNAMPNHLTLIHERGIFKSHPMNPLSRPPIYTLLVELVGWTLDRTASIPKSHRFTFGQRLDNLSLDALLLAVRAIYSERSRKHEHLTELNLILEQLRVLWRLVHDRRWISQQQLLFANTKLDEIGKMAGGWLNSLKIQK